MKQKFYSIFSKKKLFLNKLHICAFFQKYIIIHRAPEKIIEVEIPRLNLQIVQEWSTPPYKKMTEILDENKERNNCFYFFLKKGIYMLYL